MMATTGVNSYYTNINFFNTDSETSILFVIDEFAYFLLGLFTYVVYSSYIFNKDISPLLVAD